MKRVYCVELTALVKMHGTKVPVVVSNCIEELERRGGDIMPVYSVWRMHFENHQLHVFINLDPESYPPPSLSRAVC